MGEEQKDKLSFEEALTKLEEIVEKMEAGDLKLDESLKLFEEGVKLSRYCQEKLDEAEGKIEKLVGDNEEEMKTESFASPEENDHQKEAKSEQKSGGSLFGEDS